MTRRQFIALSSIGLTVILVAVLTGFAEMGPWAQFATGMLATVLASFAAPEYFGWRDPPHT